MDDHMDHTGDDHEEQNDYDHDPRKSEKIEKTEKNNEEEFSFELIWDKLPHISLYQDGVKMFLQTIHTIF